MKTLSKILIVLSGLLVSTCAQAQQTPFDVCAYPPTTPPDQLLFYGGDHKQASSVGDVTNLYDAYTINGITIQTNDANNPEYAWSGDWVIGYLTPAIDLGERFGYGCGYYNGEPTSLNTSADLSYDIDQYLVYDTEPPTSTVYESHTATSYGVTEVWSDHSLGVSDELLDPSVTNQNFIDCKDQGGTNNCPCSCHGMPQWSISEPYINLWVRDTPVFYTTSHGEEIGFELSYKQRDTRPPDTTVPPTGWSHNWFSYVHFVVPTYLSDTNSSGPGVPMAGSTGPVLIKSGYVFTNDFSKWQAILYAPDDSEVYFAYDSSTEAQTGLIMTTNSGGAANGFKLIHPDGSVDEYSLVSTNYFSFGIAQRSGRLFDLHTNAPKAFTCGGVGYYGDGNGNYAADSYATNTPPPIGEQFDYAAYDALLTKRVDPYGNAILLNYNSSAPYYLQSIEDYDGNTTSFSYDGNGMLTGVSMPYGRSASFTYSAGQMTGITDAQGMSSSFSYTTFTNIGFLYSGTSPAITNAFISSMTTPYGTTSFDHYEALGVLSISNNPTEQWIASGGGSGTETAVAGGTTSVFVGFGGGRNRVNRACTVTLPDGSHELYLYRYDCRNLVPSNYPTGQIPTDGSFTIKDVGTDPDSVDAPYGISHLLSTRNSFHWDREQYALLSTSDINSLTTNDYAVATMKHWLESDMTENVYPYGGEQNVSDQLSLVREPSPGGGQPGAMTWITYSGQSDWREVAGYNDEIAAMILPDGSVRYEDLNYNDEHGWQLESITDTYTKPDGTRGTRYVENYYGDNSEDVYDAPGFTYNRLSSIFLSADDGSYGISISLSYPSGDSEMDASYSGGGTDSYFYNSGHQITGIKHANGLTTTNLYGFDHFLTKSIDIESQATNTFSFANGLPSSITTPLGLVMNYSWDSLSRLKMVVFPDGTTISNNYNRLDLAAQKDRLNDWVGAGYNFKRQMTSFTNANGGATFFSYCNCGGLESITDPLGNSTGFYRDNNGNVTETLSSDGFATYYNRNILGQVTNLTTSAGLNLNYHYNNQGLVTNVSSSAGILYAAAYDGSDRPVHVTDAQGVTVTNLYDPLGRVTDFWNGMGQHEANDFSSQGITDHHDALSHVTYYGYDPAGRMNSIIDADNNTNLFYYNPAGQLIALTNGNGYVTSWTYDIYGRSISKTDGNGNLVETNGYDAKGNLIAHWTPAKGLTQYTYDANGNPLSVSYSSGTGISAAYDALNRIVSMTDASGSSWFGYANFGAFEGALATESGPWYSSTVTHSYANRLPSVVSAGGWTEDYGYDGLLRLSSVISPAGTFAYTYNGAGKQVSSLSLPGSGNGIANTFDAAGRLLTTALEHSSTALDSYGYTYDPTGSRTNVLRADGSQVSYGYDAIGQLTGALGHESGGTPRLNENFAYGYDPAGNLLARTNDVLTQAFTVDAANELTGIARNNELTVAGSLTNTPTSLSINGQGAGIYNDKTFAASGVNLNNGMNIFTAVVVNAGVTTASSMTNQLPASVSLTYDGNGNLIYDGQKAYQYDCANELTSVTVSNSWRNEYVYDGFGRRRVAKNYVWYGGGWQEGAEKRYVYDGNNVIQERDGNNHVLVSYTRGTDLSGTMEGAGGIGGLLARTDSSGSAFYHADGNGNITMMIDSSGNQLAKYLYDSFGNTIGMWGTLAPINTYRFSSKEIDTRSGLYYYDERYYEPNFQRWPNPDPIKELGGINLYQSVRNNPINDFDPLGLWTFSVGITFNFRIIGIDITFSGGIVGDTQGNINTYFYPGAGTTIGGSTSLGVSVAVSNAKKNCDLAGTFGNASASGFIGGGGSVDGFWGNSADGPVGGGGITVGFGLGADVAAYLTDTTIGPINPFASKNKTSP